MAVAKGRAVSQSLPSDGGPTANGCRARFSAVLAHVPALVAQPSLILADEPTGQLDTVTGANIVALLREIVTATGATVLVASHDPKMREAAVVFEGQAA